MRNREALRVHSGHQQTRVGSPSCALGWALVPKTKGASDSPWRRPAGVPDPSLCPFRSTLHPLPPCPIRQEADPLHSSQRAPHPLVSLFQPTEKPHQKSRGQEENEGRFISQLPPCEVCVGLLTFSGGLLYSPLSPLSLGKGDRLLSLRAQAGNNPRRELFLLLGSPCGYPTATSLLMGPLYINTSRTLLIVSC